MIDIKDFDDKNPEKKLKEVIPQHKENILRHAKCIGGKLIVSYMVDACDRLYVYDFSVPSKLLS